MKKLIALAAVAVAGVALASDCTIEVKPVAQKAAVFSWKFTGKTTVGYVVKSVTKTSGSACVIGTNTTTQCAIRVPGSLAIKGYTYICDVCCDAFKDWTEAGAAPDEFYMTKPFKSTLDSTIALDVAHVIGKKGTQYEMGGVATFKVADPSETYTLAFAGLGSYSKDKLVPTSVSGNFAGFVESPYYVSKGVCLPADYWQCDGETFAGQPSDKSVAYGKWSVKYNSSASKKYIDGKVQKLY